MFRSVSNLTFFALLIASINGGLWGCGGSAECIRSEEPRAVGGGSGTFLAVRVSHDAIWKRAQSTWKNGFAQKGAESFVVTIAGWEPGNCDHCVNLWVEAAGSGGTKESLQVRGLYRLRPTESSALVRFVPTAVELAGRPEEHVLTDAVGAWVREEAAQPVVEVRVPMDRSFKFEVSSVMDTQSLSISMLSAVVRGGAAVGSSAQLEVAVSHGLKEWLIQQEVGPTTRVVVEPWEWQNDSVRVSWRAFDHKCKSTRAEWVATRRDDGALEMQAGGDADLLQIVLRMRPESILGIPEGRYQRAEQSWLGTASVDPQREALASLYGDFMRCYAAARADQRLAGVVELEWTVDATGVATDAVVTYQDLESPELLECMIQTLLDAKFAPADSVQRMRRRFEFQESQRPQGN